MRRPRRRLEVSTFPFLAVLLCAMGSLILLLLVLDRRAKIAARARAEESARATLEERNAMARAAAEEVARRAEERAAERKHRQDALHEELARAADEVTTQLKAFEGRKSATARSAAAQARRWRELLEVLGSRREELAKAERETAAQRAAAGEAKDQSESASKEAARLSAQLRGLEVVLDELKAARKRDATTYSLMPYRGKRGDSRRPLYLECTADGLVFHPDRKTLSGIATPQQVRNEVETRVERQRKSVLAQGGQPEKRAYLLMLVRPDGIGTYYAALGALKAKEIDFGYEFIDADWVLDFPEGDAAPATQPWMKAQHQPVARADPSAPTRRVKGMRPGQEAEGSEEIGEGDRTGSGLGRGGSSDLPPLPGTGRGGSGGGTSVLPPLPGGAGISGGGAGQARGTANIGGNGASIAWNAVGSRTGGTAGGSDLPPLPGAPAGNGTGGSAPRGPPNGVPLPGGSRGPAIPNPDGTLPGGPPPTPGGGTGTGSGGGMTGGPDSARGTPGVPSTGGGTAPGAPAQFPSDRHGSGRTGSGGSSGGGGTGNGGSGGSGQAGGSSGNGQPSSGGATGQAGTAGVGGQPGNGQPSQGGANSRPGNGQPSQDGATGQPGTAPAEAAGGGAGVAASGGTPGPARPGQGGQPHDPDEPQGPDLGAGMLPGPERPSAPSRPRPPRLIGNRDWVIPVECRPDGAVLRNAGQKFAVTSLTTGAGGENPLLKALRLTITRRQATVRPGEPPFRPQLRFLIYPDGLKTYYLALSAVEPLGVTVTRQNVEADPSPRPSP
jgi:hypothetical protein